MQGLPFTIYHQDTGTTRGLLVGPGIPKLFDANGLPVFQVVTRNIQGQEYKHLQPVEPGHYAFGGSIGHSSDSRWPSDYPLKIHDNTL